MSLKHQKGKPERVQSLLSLVYYFGKYGERSHVFAVFIIIKQNQLQSRLNEQFLRVGFNGILSWKQITDVFWSFDH